MKIFLRWLLLLTGLTSVVCASTTRDDTARAQAALGGNWSRLIRIENISKRSLYPAVVDALVFEEAGILWFYSPTNGTQSLSRFLNRVEADKENLGPLLTAIDPGFTHFEFVANPAAGLPFVSGEKLENGCFIECLGALRDRVMRGERVASPRLLSLYVDTASGRLGHTVLTYDTPGGFFLLDPTRSARPRALPEAWRDDPTALAKVALPGARVVKSRWLEVERPRETLVAGLGRSQAGKEGAPRLTQ